MHLFAVGIQKAYTEPVAANRIHDAVQEVLAKPSDFTRADLLERIHGCWEDARGILLALANSSGKILVDPVTKETVASATVQDELHILSKDLLSLAARVGGIMPSNKKGPWQCPEFRKARKALWDGMSNLVRVAMAMRSTAESLARGSESNPGAPHLIFQIAQ